MALNLKNLLMSIFPFLFNAMQRAWDGLTSDQQDAITNAGIIGQYLKKNLTALAGDLVKAISDKTGIDPKIVENTLISLAKQMGFTGDLVDDAVKYLQDLLTKSSATTWWNGILSMILKTAAIELSGGTLDWVHIALGIGEWAYQTFLKPHEDTFTITASQPPTQSINNAAPEGTPQTANGNIPLPPPADAPAGETQVTGDGN